MTTAPLNIAPRRPPPPSPHTTDPRGLTRASPPLPQDIYHQAEGGEHLGGRLRHPATPSATAASSSTPPMAAPRRSAALLWCEGEPAQGGDHQRDALQVAFGTGAGGRQGEGVIIGDNGRVPRRRHHGRSCRATPEHTVSIQFNPFDDYYEPDGNPTKPATNEFSGGHPFGNGSHGLVLYNWAKTGEEALTDCLPTAPRPTSTARPPAGSRRPPVPGTKPEVATILRTNCGGSLNLGQPSAPARAATPSSRRPHRQARERRRLERLVRHLPRGLARGRAVL